MAAQVETARLELETNAEQYAKEIAQAENALERLQVQLKLSPKEFDRLDAAMDKEVDKLEILRRQLASTESQLAKMDAAGGRATNKLKGLGQVGLQTGRVIQDFAQGGIGGVLNNIEGFAQAVGGGPGLAGVLTGLGVAVFIAKPYLDDFMEALSPEKPRAYADALKDLQATIKELEDKPVKFGIDVSALEVAKRQLAELQKARAAFEAAGEGKTALEKEAGSSFEKQFNELGGAGKEARDAVVVQQAAAKDAIDPEIGKALAKMAAASADIQAGAKLHGVSPTINENDADWHSLPMATQQGFRMAWHQKELALRAIGTEQSKNRQAASDEFGALFEGVKAGNNSDARNELAARFRGIGNESLAKMTEGASPEKIQATREEDQQAEAEDAKFDRDIAERKAAIRRRNANAKKREAERTAKANDNARALENDPTIKAEIEANRKKFGDHRDIEGGGGSEARAKAKQIKGAAEGGKADRAPLNPQAIEAAEETQQIMRMMLGMTREQANKIQQMRAENRRMAADIAQQRRFMEMPGPTPLDGGQ